MRIARAFVLSCAGALILTLAACSTDTSDDGVPPREGSQGTTGSESADLFTGSLHDVDMPAKGTAHLDVDGSFIEFADVNCKHQEGSNGEDFTVGATTEDETLGPVQLTIKRVVGDGTRLPFESEEVQLTLVGGTEHREKNGISRVDHFRDKSGEGDIPIIRI